MKQCSRCGTLLPLEDFPLDSSRKTGRHPYCRTCKREVAANFRERFKSKTLAYSRQHYQKNKAKYAKRNRRYYEEHKELVLAQTRERARANPERTRSYQQKYQQSEKAKIKEKRFRASPTGILKNRNDQHVRRARMRLAIVEKVKLKEIIQRDSMRCHLCGLRVSKKTLSFDHLIPISKGGSHTEANIAVAHRLCNSKRGAGRIPAQLRLRIKSVISQHPQSPS